MKHKWLLGLAALSLLGVYITSHNAKEVKAIDDEYIPVTGNWQFHHLRMHSGGDNKYPGTWYQFTNFESFTNKDASLFRIPLTAEHAGTYTISFNYVTGYDTYPIKVFVNDQDGQVTSLPGSGDWETVKTHNLLVNLNEGNNIVIIQVRDWGWIREFKLSDGLSLQAKRSTDDIYYFEDQLNVGSHLFGNLTHSYFLCLMIQKIHHEDVVHVIFNDTLTDTVILFQRIIFVLEFLICFFHAL